MSLAKRDRSMIWHPLTYDPTSPLPIVIKKGKGAYLFDEQGKAYLDLISSWWVNVHGHGHETIAKAIYEQALKLEHVIFAGFTHEPAIELCERVQSVLPKPLSRFFFSDNGTTSVEVAIKMAYQFFKGKKPYFLSFEGGYHGDTVGSMSVGSKSGFHGQFQNLCFKTFFIPFPATFQNDNTIKEKEAQALNQLQFILEKHGNNIAAFILEPLIQGASGMRICRKEFLVSLLNIVRSYDILIIFDEVMTGFGRTGSLFALDHLNFQPDFLCLSKGLTGGFLPMSLTVTTNTIYENFDQVFSHSHSYTANPLSCAASIASFDLLQKTDTHSLCQTQKEGLERLTQVKNKRCLGTIAAFDVPNDQVSFLKQKCFHEGFIIRPLKNTIYFLPPYCVTRAELLHAYEFIERQTNNG